MHTRRTSTLPTLALALPHPPLPKRTATSPPPHTPRSGPSNSFFGGRQSFSPRTSSDSWNSYSENGDEEEHEWTQEQTSLLSRTLEALPSHLITPFIGPVPPSNLLDNIARTIAKAKGPVDWPHSIRATRVKLLELSKALARENAKRRVLDEQEEDVLMMDESSKENLNERSTKSSTAKRPLYRQSSMDFLPKKKESGSLSRLSNRLQRTDRIITNPGFHPYARPASRSPSPQQLSQTPSAPITRSQTLRARALTAGGPTMASRPTIRRVSSAIFPPPNPITSRCKPSEQLPTTPCVSRTPSLTNLSDAAPAAPAPPPPARLRRVGSFTAPTRSSLLKRAPSFGAASICSTASVRSSSLEVLGEDAPLRQDGSLSSDEEEKARQKQVKRARTGTVTAIDKGEKTPRATTSPKTTRTTRASNKSPKAGSTSPMDVSKSPVLLPKDKEPSKRLRPKHRREPSFFGAELPSMPAEPVGQPVAISSEHPQVPTRPSSPVADEAAPVLLTPILPPARQSKTRPKLLITTENLSPNSNETERAKRLRRIRTRDFPSRPGRRISFSNLVPAADEDASPRDGHGLASAIQLP